MPEIKPSDRYRGALLGLAAGDALGTTLEFKSPGTFPPHKEITGGGPFKLKPGEWTDDTSMALCLAASLVECNGFDPTDQMQRYVRWWKKGYMSSTGDFIDIGNTVRDALQRFIDTGDPYSGSTDEHSAGNGSIMRLAPVPLFFASEPRQAIERATDSSRTTHGAREAVDACRYFAGLILGALQGRSKEEILSPRFTPVDGLWDEAPLAPKIDDIAAGSFREKDPPEIRGTGYVVQSLEAALWAFDRTDDFRTGAVHAVNLGDDADTTGAVYGQLAGAYYGAAGIPERWRRILARREEIETVAHRLGSAASSNGALRGLEGYRS